MGASTLSMWVKQSGHEADHSPPPSAEVKNAWSYTSIPQYVFMAWYLMKHDMVFSYAQGLYLCPFMTVSPLAYNL
jgi:hypothetical protein